MPGSTTNGCSRSVLISTTRISPRYPESIRPGRVDDADAVPRREAGAWLDEPGVPFRDLDRDTRSGRRRARPEQERDALTGGEVEPGVAVVCLPWQLGVGAKPPDGNVDHRADTRSRSVLVPATR